MKARISHRSLFDLVFFSTGFVVCLILAWNLNFKEGKPLEPGLFSADKNCYYLYLPVTFIYGWDVQKLPHGEDTIYDGTTLDYANGTYINKMTCGVAILWTPFFLVSHAIAVIFDLQPDGYSIFYQKMALVPPVIFLMLGLFFLKRFLENYFPGYIAYGCILFIFAGTNLYHFGLKEGLMSHVHSFFLFSLYLFLLKKYFDSHKKSFPLFMGICLVISLAILIRPSNLIILVWPLLLDAKTTKEVFKRILFFIRPKNLLTFLVIGFIVFIPQFLYWKFASGSFIHYSYGAERFAFWKNPVILPLYFSPLNGLFLYNPLVLFFVAGFLWMVIRRKTNGILLLMTFALVTYISGSWHMWYFGSSFGSRPFVEYYALFSLGFGYFLLETMRLKNLFIRSLVILLMFVFSYYNLRLIYYNYWNTNSVWAWDEFKNRLDFAGIFHFSRDTYTYINDIENWTFEREFQKTYLYYHSRNISALLDSRYLYCSVYHKNMTQILDHEIGKVSTSMWVSPITSDSTNAYFVLSIEDDMHSPFLSASVPVNQFLTKKGQWSEVTISRAIPQWLNDQAYSLNVYIRNPGRRTFFVDDIRVKVE